MIGPRLAGLLLPVLTIFLSLAAAPLSAQPAAEDDAPAQVEAGDANAGENAPPAPGAEAPSTPGAAAGSDSPFDYRPSEKISEDLPVSFPVDI